MIRNFGPYQPEVHSSSFLIDTATVIGRVMLGELASLWPGTILRADVERIVIGPRTNLQDGVLVHVNHGRPVVIGAGVTVGHGAIIHGCTVGDNTLIGMGAILLDGSEIGDDCLVGAGSVVTPDTRIPRGHLALGTPARVIRPLTSEEIENNRKSAVEYIELARTHLRDARSA